MTAGIAKPTGNTGLTGDGRQPEAWRLTPDRETVSGEPDGFTRAQADFSFGDRDDAMPPVSQCPEHAERVRISGCQNGA
jgi:hypothetical protein